MNKNLIIAIIVLVIIVGAGAYFLAPKKPQANLSETILFFGDGCPHCANVEKFIVENKVEDKIKITRKEVPFNGKTSSELKDNAQLLGQLAIKCNISTDKIGIPFLWNGSSCVVGDTDIIKFFKEETK